jgi:hypothetical protein
MTLNLMLVRFLRRHQTKIWLVQQLVRQRLESSRSWRRLRMPQGLLPLLPEQQQLPVRKSGELDA